jgi:Ni/Co efflux regulator RcnB
MIGFILLATTAATPLVAQNAMPRAGQEARENRAEIRRDRQEVRQGRAEVRGDVARGDYREARQDRRELNRDRGELRADQREAGRDRDAVRDGRSGSYAEGRRDARQDWRDNRGDRRDDRFDRRGDGRDGRAYGYNGGNNGNRGWNNGWRNDSRYNWQGYRSANRNLYRMPRYAAPRGYGSGYSRWSPGYRVQPYFYGRNYWISDPWRYRLPPAYGGYQWVRYYDDVALVDIRTGLIADIIYSFFY